MTSSAGELSLDGGIRRRRGVLPIAAAARRRASRTAAAAVKRPPRPAVVAGLELSSGSVATEAVGALNRPESVRLERGRRTAIRARG